MLSTLSSPKLRPAIDALNVQYDLLTNALTSLSSRFEKYTNRTLSRTVNTTHEFGGDDTEVIPTCIPVETVSKFELKSNEAEGWLEQTNVEYIIRNSSVIYLTSRIGSWRQQ